MNIAIDITLIATTVITIIIYTKKGFVRSILGVGKYIVAVICACAFSAKLSGYISNTLIFEKIKYFVSENSIWGSVTLDEVPILAVSNAICNFIAFFVIFVVVVCFLNLLMLFLDKIFECPVLTPINKVAGFLFGVGAALLNLFMCSALIKVFLNIFWAQTASVICDSTVIYKLVSNNDIISHFVNMLFGRVIN